MGEVVNVISASRRTDVPAFYWRWFRRRVDAGFCDVANPFDPRRVRRVSLRAEDVAAIVFWTRDARPMLPDIDRLEGAGYAFYVQYTVNGYPRELEPHAPKRSEAVAALRALASRLGPDRVIWRYDPIVFSSATPAKYHIEQFSALAHDLRGAASTVTISFCDPYGKTRRNFARLSSELGWSFDVGRPDEHAALAGRLAEVAAESGMQLATCAEAALRVPGVKVGRCVDPRLVSRLRPDLNLRLRAAPSRPGCGCIESVDIGAYDTCVFGCVYCYANRSLGIARRRRAEHDPEDAMLWRPHGSSPRCA